MLAGSLRVALVPVLRAHARAKYPSLGLLMAAGTEGSHASDGTLRDFCHAVLASGVHAWLGLQKAHFLPVVQALLTEEVFLRLVAS